MFCKKQWLCAGMLALAIVTLVFFDVIFFDRTLQPSNIAPHMGQPLSWHASSVALPVTHPEKIASDGFADLNASAWQFEPARYWLARTLAQGDSPWWNPYSAAGTVGPEVLVDIKFSPHTLVSAKWFSASPASFDVGLVVIYSIGVFFILLLLRQILGLDWLAAIAGSVVFLLGGFALPNLNTHIGQPYFLSPVLLFSVFCFARQQTIGRWILLVFAHALLLTASILTTLSLVLLTAHILGTAFFIAQHRVFSLGSLAGYWLRVMAACGVALMLVAPLWFPILDSFFVTDMVSDFSARALQKPRRIENALSVFTPRHFWENYNHVSAASLYPLAGLEKQHSLIAYTGIVGALMASFAVSIKNRKQGIMALAALLVFLLPYLRVFGFAGFLDNVPVLRSIGNQYWGCMSSLALVVLVALGVQRVKDGTANGFVPALVLCLQLSCLWLLYKQLGWPEVFPYGQYVMVVFLLVFFSALSLGLIVGKRSLAQPVLVVLVAAMFIELLSYMNPVRPLRYSPVHEAPDFVQFLKKNIADGRVLNIGQSHTLYPEYGSMFGIKQADTQTPGLLPWYENFFDRYFGNDTFFFLSLDGSVDRKRKKASRKEYMLDAMALDVASVKYVVVADNASAYIDFLRGANYPEVYRADGVIIFENVDYIPSVSLADVSVGEALDARRVNGNVQVVSYRNADIIVEAETVHPAKLVLSDVWHPAWKATVDETPVSVERINEAFRGVLLPAGKHRVHFYYEPPALRYGVYAAGSAIFLIILLLLWRYGLQRHVLLEESPHE